MSKGGGGAQTVTQTTLPDYAKPYVERLFERAESESQRGYQPYGQERIAGPSGTTLESRQLISGLGTGISGLPQAQQAVQGAMGQAQQYGDMQNPLSAFQYGPAGTYTGQNVSQYMSPYMQNVLDVQKAQAQLDFDRAQAGRDAAAVQAGAFGGSRSAVVDALAQEDLARRMQEIQATGQQQAFEQGVGMFEADRQARMAMEQAQAAELARQQAGEFDVAQMGLAGLGLSSDLAGQLAQLGGAERQAAIEQAGLLDKIGKEETAYEQALMSQDYQDFLRQQNYQRDQLQFYGDILRGNIRQGDMTQMDYSQANPYQQLLGGGLAALGMYQGMG